MHECLFCSQKETVFHAFLHYSSLPSLFFFFFFLKVFHVDFTFKVLIRGFKYIRRNRFKCQLTNFILGQDKLVNRKNKLEQNTDCDSVKTLSRLMKSRIVIDFNF